MNEKLPLYPRITVFSMIDGAMIRVVKAVGAYEAAMEQVVKAAMGLKQAVEKVEKHINDEYAVREASRQNDT